MEKVKAIRDFPGSTINRDELGLVEKGAELEVSPNDAAYLEREGFAERIEQEPAPEETPAAETSEAGTSTGEPAASGPSSSGKKKSG